MTKPVVLVCLLALVVGCGDDERKPTPPGGVKLDTSGVGLVENVTATGRSVKLDGQFEHAVIARRNGDGSLTVECHDDQLQAEAFVHGTTTAHGPEVQ